MQLPKITFSKKDFPLYISDFDCSQRLRPLRAMQIMQDIATDHANILGVGWDVMHKHGMLWVLGKIKVTFHKPVKRGTSNVVLYTWPLAPSRFYGERCFTALNDNGEQLFSATSMWMIISFADRKMLSAEKMLDFYHGEFSTAHSDTLPNYARVRMDETYSYAYTKTVRRSDLDLNGHVNNTNYITYALDALAPNEVVDELEIVYNKELLLGDEVKIYTKRQDDIVNVVGVNKETSFTVVMKTHVLSDGE